MKKLKKHIVLFAAIIGTLIYSTQSPAQVSCPITLAANSSTTIYDGGVSNCAITINNGVSLSTSGRSMYVNNSGTTVVNYGTIQSTGSYAIGALGTYGQVGSVTNTNIISGKTAGIYITGGINTINNSGQITNIISGDGITNDSGELTNLINTNTITGYGVGSGVSVGTSSTAYITTVTNSGAITGGASGYGVNVSSTYGTITTLNNRQGGNGAAANSTALSYNGKLPTNYNIIVASPTQYGQLHIVR